MVAKETVLDHLAMIIQEKMVNHSKRYYTFNVKKMSL